MSLRAGADDLEEDVRFRGEVCVSLADLRGGELSLKPQGEKKMAAGRETRSDLLSSLRGPALG